MAESKAKLDMLALADKERTMLEEAKNDYEAYIYYIRNKLVDYEEEIAKVTSEEQREALRKSAEDAEEWLFDDGYTADLKTFQEKHAELSAPAEKAFFRMSELTARPKAIEALSKRLAEAEDLMQVWEKTMTHITEEERTEVLDKVEVVRSWIEDKVGEQDKADATADPVFTSQEVPGQAKKIDAIIERLRKKPKPKPIKKNETESLEKNATETPEDADESSKTTESDGEKVEDEVPKAEEVKESDGETTGDEVPKAEEVKDHTEKVVEDEL
jgi:hypoxia up-regulated 1